MKGLIDKFGKEIGDGLYKPLDSRLYSHHLLIDRPSVVRSRDIYISTRARLAESLHARLQ